MVSLIQYPSNTLPSIQMCPKATVHVRHLQDENRYVTILIHISHTLVCYLCCPCGKMCMLRCILQVPAGHDSCINFLDVFTLAFLYAFSALLPWLNYFRRNFMLLCQESKSAIFKVIFHPEGVIIGQCPFQSKFVSIVCTIQWYHQINCIMKIAVAHPVTHRFCE